MHAIHPPTPFSQNRILTQSCKGKQCRSGESEAEKAKVAAFRTAQPVSRPSALPPVRPCVHVPKTKDSTSEASEVILECAILTIGVCKKCSEVSLCIFEEYDTAESYLESFRILDMFCLSVYNPGQSTLLHLGELYPLTHSESRSFTCSELRNSGFRNLIAASMTTLILLRFDLKTLCSLNFLIKFTPERVCL